MPAIIAWPWGLAWAQSAAVRMKVADLFPHVLDGLPCSKPSTLATRWLTDDQRRHHEIPRLAQLLPSVLSTRAVFKQSLRMCASSDALVPSGFAPSNFCCYPSDRSGNSFDQWAVERTVLARWLADSSMTICDAERGECADAEVVVVPSLHMHFFSTHSYRWSWVRCLRSKAYDAYWMRLAGIAAQPRLLKPDALIVIVNTWYFCNDSMMSFVDRLLGQDAAFKARLLITAPMSSVQLNISAAMGAGWHDNGLLELERRERLAGEPRAGPITAVTDPIILSVPVTVGLPDSPVRWADREDPSRPIEVLLSGGVYGRRGFGPMRNAQFVRPLIADAMLRAGGACGKKACLICRAGGSACANVTDVGLFRGTVRAVFCVEPPGDTFGRSHFLVAVLGGCIPVMVDGGHEAYPRDHPAWWPWRLPRGFPPLQAEGCPAVDYSRFTVILNASQASSPRWLDELHGLSRDSSKLRRMQRALQEAAPALRYAWSTAAAGGCDAMTMLNGVVARAAKVTRQLHMARRAL